MASKKKEITIDSYLNSKYRKSMHGKKRYKDLSLQVWEMNREILKERKKKIIPD